MQLILRVLQVFVLVAAIGCVSMPGDSICVVTGKVVVPAGIESDRCSIGLFRDSKDTLVKARQVNLEFNLTFTVDPKPDWYHFVLQCENLGCYESQRQHLGSVRSYSDPVDLGNIRPEDFSPCKIDLGLSGAETGTGTRSDDSDDPVS